MKRYKLGFTLAETLLTIFIIATIAAITIPVIISLIPDRTEKLRNKVTHLVEDTVAQMANDDTMYPQNRQFSKQGFKNTDPVIFDGHTYEGDTKFCELFAHKFVSIDTEIDCSAPDAATGDHEQITIEHFYDKDGTDKGEWKFVRTFRSHDQMDWYLPVSNFTTDNNNIIMVDINTAQNGDNCMETDPACTKANHKKPDLIAFYVRSNGTITRIQPTNPPAQAYTITVKKECPSDSDSCGTFDVFNEDNLEQSICGADGITCGEHDTATSNIVIIKGLSSNVNYILKANPEENFYSNWRRRVPKQREVDCPDGTEEGETCYENVFDSDGNITYIDKDNERKINLTGYDLNTNVKLKFYKQSKVTFSVNVRDCEEETATDCVTATLDGRSGTASGNVIQFTDLTPGIYTLSIAPHHGDNYFTSPVKIKDGDDCIQRSRAIDQQIKIGSEDVSYTVTVVKGSACTGADGYVEED